MRLFNQDRVPLQNDYTILGMYYVAHPVGDGQKIRWCKSRIPELLPLPAVGG